MAAECMQKSGDINMDESENLSLQNDAPADLLCQDPSTAVSGVHSLDSGKIEVETLSGEILHWNLLMALSSLAASLLDRPSYLSDSDFSLAIHLSPFFCLCLL